MNASSLNEQFLICKKTLDGLDEAGANIARLASEYDTIVDHMHSSGYLQELQAELIQMNTEFQHEVNSLKSQLFNENIKYVHAQGQQLSNAISNF